MSQRPCTVRIDTMGVGGHGGGQGVGGPSHGHVPKIHLMPERICLKRHLRGHPPPKTRGFRGGLTPIDIFKTTQSISMKIFLGQLQHILSSEKNFRGP